MTRRECAVIMAYTGIAMLTGDNLKYFYEYVTELLGRPAYTHDFITLAEEIKQRAAPEFIELCNPEEG